MNSTWEHHWYLAASVAEVPDGGVIERRANGRRVAVFRVGEIVYATEATCPIDGASLGDGAVADGEVRCPTHGGAFVFARGADEPAGDALRVHPVMVVDDEVFVHLPEDGSAAEEGGCPG